MALIIATGSNLGDRYNNLVQAKEKLSQLFHFEAASRVFCSEAVDYTDQPSFYNQVLQFSFPGNLSPEEIMKSLLLLEEQMGRVRKINKGPRLIDLDILFLGTESYQDPSVTIPHPRLFSRSFVVLPLKELPFYSTLKKHYHFPREFDNEAFPLN